MAQVKRLVLDVLKPHHPNSLDFAIALAELGSDYNVKLTVIEVDDKTETITLNIECQNILFEDVSETIEKMGASIHSIDEVEVDGGSEPE